MQGALPPLHSLPDLPGSMVVRTVKQQSPETIVLLFSVPQGNRPGSVQVIESARTIPFVPAFTDSELGLDFALTNRIRKELQGALGLSVAVRLVEPRTLERSQGKAKRVIDRRDLGA